MPKGGGAAFECSDYEGMYLDLKSFLSSTAKKFYRLGQEAEAHDHLEKDLDAYREGLKEGLSRAKAIFGEDAISELKDKI